MIVSARLAKDGSPYWMRHAPTLSIIALSIGSHFFKWLMAFRITPKFNHKMGTMDGAGIEVRQVLPRALRTALTPLLDSVRAVAPKLRDLSTTTRAIPYRASRPQPLPGLLQPR